MQVESMHWNRLHFHWHHMPRRMALSFSAFTDVRLDPCASISPDSRHVYRLKTCLGGLFQHSNRRILLEERIAVPLSRRHRDEIVVSVLLVPATRIQVVQRDQDMADYCMGFVSQWSRWVSACVAASWPSRNVVSGSCSFLYIVNTHV